jgi:hypothetical protein
MHSPSTGLSAALGRRGPPGAQKNPKLSWGSAGMQKSDPDGTRTRVTAVKGRCPRPLDDGANRHADKTIAKHASLSRHPGHLHRFDGRCAHKKTDCARSATQTENEAIDTDQAEWGAKTWPRQVFVRPAASHPRPFAYSSGGTASGPASAAF